MRWIQKYNKETGKSEFIPVDESARKHDERHGIIVRGNFEAFRSTVDGSIIDSHRALEQHNKRNGVVNASEFSPEYLAKKRQERDDFYQGRHSREESQKRKMELYETITRAEREHGR